MTSVMATAPEIPLDIRDAMHDCILAVFWPKKKIVEFLLSVDCPPQSVASPDTEMSRHSIVVDAFSRLSARPDRGYPVFQKMIDRLANWSYFDPYYFEKLGKLDRTDAESKISRLKKAVDSRNATATIRRTASSQAQAKQVKTADLRALHRAFAKLFGTGMSPQGRGKLFETFLRELFDRQSIKMGDGHRLTGEEIDGTFKFEGENYIVEAKWQEASVSTNQLYHFRA